MSVRNLNRGKKRGRGGFTLVEVIGMMAVIAIIAAMVAPKIVDQIQRAALEAEQSTLRTLVQGLEQHIILNRAIPDATVTSGIQRWAADVATQVNISSSLVQTNDRGYNRYYVWRTGADPDLTDASGGYDQTAAFADAIVSGTRPQIIIVSSISSNISGLASGELDTTAKFDELWDWNGSSAIATAFTMSSDVAKRNLVVQRFNTAHLFHEISLLSRSVTRTGNGFIAQDIAAGAAPRNLLNVPNNTVITGVSLQSDSFGAGVSLEIGCSGDDDCSSNEFETSNIPVDSGFSGNLTDNLPLTVNTSATVIDSDIASGSSNTSNAGYLSVTVEYQATPQYDLDDLGTLQDVSLHTCSATATVYDTLALCVAAPCAGACFPSETNFFVIQGTKLSLYDNAATPALLHTMFVNISDSFWFTPGPPAAWGR